MKAGIYVVKNNVSERKYLVALNGIEPFIRITNAIDLTDFTNSKIEKNHEVIDNITKSPDQFTFVYLSNEIEKEDKVKEPIKREPILFTDEEYLRFTREENIDDCGNLILINTVADIQVNYHITWDEAKEIFERVNNRFNNEDKWKKLKKNPSSISEGNSVIN